MSRSGPSEGKPTMSSRSSATTCCSTSVHPGQTLEVPWIDWRDDRPSAAALEAQLRARHPEVLGVRSGSPTLGRSATRSCGRSFETVR